MSWDAFRFGLLAMDLPSLSADQLRGLLKFGVPLPEEANALVLYLKVWQASMLLHARARTHAHTCTHGFAGTLWRGFLGAMCTTL